ncbi:ROK family transcriptional regulator [Tessaracoccus palaemonis]|uniref:ROK family protein n=1 Tax=Tessaracoccus palaemonis TaxID=2829499 RepID=A0ABX8SIG0_9ACTN|nr:ROK family transcriptional regulator [Tessaracoccus palaemonis]QXT63095.1 ROK family protein [Tessaracoccus palaemonis]
METQHAPGSAGHVLSIMRDLRPRTRSQLADLTGQARTTVSQRLDLLLDAGLIREAEHSAATRGRPSAAFEFDVEGNHALAVDLGANHATYAVTDFSGRVLADASDDVSIAEGPAAIMELVVSRLGELVGEAGIAPDSVRTAGVGLPGPVDHASGLPSSPPIMPGWDGYDARGRISARFGCPVFVDNDANVMALGERAAAHPGVDDLLFVKLGTGIGAGIISGGRLLHGADGAAGDLGHAYSPAADGRPCRCGNRGCLETVAGGLAITQALQAEGLDVQTPRDVVESVRRGDLRAVRALRTAGRAIGDVLATCTALFNPAVVVLGGEIVAAGEPVLAGVRESVFARTLPLASRRLQITVAQAGSLGGVRGAAQLAIDGALSPGALEAILDHSLAS